MEYLILLCTFYFHKKILRTLTISVEYQMVTVVHTKDPSSNKSRSFHRVPISQFLASCVNLCDFMENMTLANLSGYPQHLDNVNTWLLTILAWWNNGLIFLNFISIGKFRSLTYLLLMDLFSCIYWLSNLSRLHNSDKMNIVVNSCSRPPIYWE